jgi:hypothetical protein
MQNSQDMHRAEEDQPGGGGDAHLKGLHQREAQSSRSADAQ